MAWNTPLYESGVHDAMNMGRDDTIPNMIWRFCQVAHRSVSEYRVGWERGIRRVLIDRGELAMCANFILMVEAQQPYWASIQKMLRAGKARWVRDPEHYAVVGLEVDGRTLMIMYLEDGDFEESARLLDMIDR